MSEPAIVVRDLAYAIRGKKVLSGISLSIPSGQYLTVIGPNGAGKTTLLKCLIRILSDVDGSISVFGRPLKEYSQKELAKSMSYVPQADGRVLSFTVREFVAMGRYPYLSPFSVISNEDRTAIEEALDLTGMSGLKERNIETLSGGERQCVFIAAAIAQGAKVLLLDEPTTFLDPRHQMEIHDLLERLNRTLGMTIIAVTHDINCAALWSDHIVALKEGRVSFSGTGAELMCNETLQRIYQKKFIFVEHPRGGLKFVAPDRRRDE